MSHSIQVVSRHECAVTSPTFDADGSLFTISSSGDIYKYVGDVAADRLDGEVGYEAWGNSSGQPLGLAFDGNVAYVCDAAHQAVFRIMRKEGEDGQLRQEIEPYVREYEQSQFLGPNGLALLSGEQQDAMLYFSDSGPFGETSVQNPKGSVFAVNPATQLLIPLCLNSLAHPCGVALSPDGAFLYVAETGMNRILRFTQSPKGVYHCSVFHQLSGRFGPTAIAVNNNGDVFVAQFDFSRPGVENGRVVVIDLDGEVSAIMSVPGPEITGLALTPDQKHLIITERSTCSVYRQAIR